MSNPTTTGPILPQPSQSTLYSAYPSRSRRSPRAGPMRSRGWPTGCSRRATHRPLRPTGTRSWSTWTPRCSRGAGPGGAKSSRTRPLAGETARRLCCDAGIVATVDGPTGEPLAVGTAHPHHSPRDAPCAAHTRPRMPLPRVRASTHRLHGPSRAALGQGWRDLARQPAPALPIPPPAGGTRGASSVHRPR